MVLDVAQFLAQNISKEMKISHFDCKLYCGKAKKIKPSIKAQITEKYGEAYLEDANYLIIVSGEAIKTSDAKKKLFGIFDRALGSISNNMAKSDIKDMTEKSQSKEEEDEEAKEAISFRFLKITLK